MYTSLYWDGSRVDRDINLYMYTTLQDIVIYMDTILYCAVSWVARDTKAFRYQKDALRHDILS